MVGVPRTIYQGPSASTAYVTLEWRASSATERSCGKKLVVHVSKEIGPIPSPDKIQFAPGLPKNPLGAKIMRRILRKNRRRTSSARWDDTSTLADPGVGGRPDRAPAEQARAAA